MRNKKVALHNLGCKVNAYETEAMQELLEKAGYQIVDFKQDADVYIVNTCSVTNIADRKSRQMLHRSKKQNPGAVIVACGCYVETMSQDQIDESIDIVVGNNKKKDIVNILDAYFDEQNDEKTHIEMVDINHTSEYEDMLLSQTAEHTRAYIKVQDGCNQFCSYCVIPYARGRVRSRKAESVVREVEALAENGYKEVVLTGIHISSYGIDTGDDLLSLILKVHEIEGVERIRLGSLEPRIITDEFAGTLAGLSKFCPHFHLSLQSGSNATLKRMNRKYTAEEYLEKCTLIRKYFDHPAITTDVIVGFPGETEEEFEESRAFVDQVDFYETHVFKYSKREGTRAAVMPDQIPESVKTERSSILLELNRQKKRAYEEKLIGTVQEILVEEEIERDGKKIQVGHTKEYVKIGITSEQDLKNQLVRIEIKNLDQIID